MTESGSSAPAARVAAPRDEPRARKGGRRVSSRGRVFLFGALSLLIVVGIARFAGHRAAAGTDSAGGTLTIGLSTDTAIIDPSITGSAITALISRNVVDSLVGQASDNGFTPWLAERWEIDRDRSRYTFHLRSGVTFSDGTALDAIAVKFNLDRILDPKTASNYARSLLGPVESVSAPDERTVVIAYRRPFAPLLQALSLPYLGIQSPTYLRAAKSTQTTLIGSGPFRLDAFVKGSGSRLSRREDYGWGPRLRSPYGTGAPRPHRLQVLAGGFGSARRAHERPGPSD